MTAFDAMIVDELRREHWRNRPPSRMLVEGSTAYLCRIESDGKLFYRVLWKLGECTAELNRPLSVGSSTITLLEAL